MSGLGKKVVNREHDCMETVCLYYTTLYESQLDLWLQTGKPGTLGLGHQFDLGPATLSQL